MVHYNDLLNNLIHFFFLSFCEVLVLYCSVPGDIHIIAVKNNIHDVCSIFLMPHWGLVETGFNKLFFVVVAKKSCIRETKHLSTNADSSTNAIGGWTKAKSATKKNCFLRGDFRPLPNKNVQMLDHFFPLLFPKDSESLKILDIRLRKVGAKRS